MCGIAGFWGQSIKAGEREPVLKRMAEAMRHRGPDAQGTWTADPAEPGLAHARLSVLDLSPAGAQPMISASGRFVLVYNGEIYNYMRIREELASMGQAPPAGWSGHGDTEVLLAAIEALGIEETLPRLIGMFAFALWDRARRELVLVRDRMGIKPLYYGLAGADLVFASELKPVMQHPGFEKTIDRSALSLFLRYNYVPDPYCIFSGMRKLSPGRLVRFSESNLASRSLPETHTYGSVNQAVLAGLGSQWTGPEDQALDAVEELIKDSVSLRLVSDVPLGAFLSGGIDSSAVVALMREAASGPVKTYTVGYAENAYNEANDAKAVAERLDTEHTELYVTSAQALKVVPELPKFYDEPFADSSQIPSFLISRLARSEVTVALSGDGGDELFAGYNRYLAAPALWNKISRMPPFLRKSLHRAMRSGLERPLAGLYSLIEPLMPKDKRQRIFRDKLQKVVDALPLKTREEFFHSLASMWQDPASAVINGSEPPTAFTDPAARPPTDDFIMYMMAVDQVSYLPGDILTKMDRASMAVSLEARVPLLDHRVVELAWRLPLEWKIKDGLGKWPLRRILYKRIPRQILDRPKMGFGAPIDRWLRGPLKPWAEELLDENRLENQGLLRPGPVLEKWKAHQSGKRNFQHHLWSVLMFQAWIEEYGL